MVEKMQRTKKQRFDVMVAIVSDKSVAVIESGP
jgi:hypothetical protein